MRVDHKNAAKTNFQKFHGRAPSKFTSIDFTMPKSLTYLGTLNAIEYVSDKKLQGSFKKRLYRHKAGPGVKVYLHPNGKWVFISGGKFRVTDWMRG